MNFLIADAVAHSRIFEIREIAGLRKFVVRALLVG